MLTKRIIAKRVAVGMKTNTNLRMILYNLEHKNIFIQTTFNSTG